MDGPTGRLDVVNPVIVAKSVKQANIREGCLSVPKEFVLVPSRMEWVRLQYSNMYGEVQTVVLKGIHAVCAQHEIDHLDGKIFLSDKSIPKYERKRLSKKWGIK